MPTLSKADVTASRQLLADLIAEVGRHESLLSGGRKLRAGETRKKLRLLENFKVGFGDPRLNLTRLTPRLLKELGNELDPTLRAQLRDQYEMYYLSLPVNLRPARGTSFWRVECQLALNNPQGDEPIIQSQFPQGEWQPVLAWGGNFTLALDAGVEWGMEVGTGLSAKIDKLPVRLKPRVAGHDGLAGFIRLPDFSFSLGRASIVAEGNGSSAAFWRLEGQDVKRAQNLQFGVVFKVPKGTRRLVLEGLVQADPDFDWIVTNLQNVWERLGKSFRALLTQPHSKRHGPNRLFLGDSERWELTLRTR